MSCGCSGTATTTAVAGSSQQRLWRVLALGVAAWLVAKGRWGTLAALGLAFVAYRASKKTAAASTTTPTVAVPNGFTTGTDNVDGSASPTTTVQGISPTISSGDC